MTLLSTLSRSSLIAGKGILARPKIMNPNLTLIKESHHRTMEINRSSWVYRKFFDLLHYYVMIGIIPLAALVTYTNVFIGPATLAPIPEGYRPKHWEYYRHPISRWLQRYCYTDEQMEYEKYLHYLYDEDAVVKLNILEKKIRDEMKKHKDYKAFYYRPVDATLMREVMRQSEDISTKLGDFTDNSTTFT